MLAAFLTLIESESDKHKFEQIYNKYKDLIHNIAFRHINDFHLAQDATQLTFERIAKSINKFDDVDSPDTAKLISTIAKYAAIYTYNQINPNEFDSIEEYSEFICKNDDYSDDYILEALHKLDQRYSSILLLKLQFGFSDKEIAGITGLPLNTVKTRVSRGRTLLAEMLKSNV